ncbi:uncharacterized protein BO80DRAFT_502094 [Aspergillus ibericus CBS 121593]|uniref:Uncharacterized protein n=1 Tax=Aspergillus ibericus CBS 121593 TaxID=1448316 RepID=A0A395H0K5_9EURO|nr:hypothetical protein BO80DRAFT_502094 [Aspergillus ibericus CBS 121593]RAL01123.1 hypothetical protein BO80DRAFT_502094 [Aspergillus ibericus CBS 121593]
MQPPERRQPLRIIRHRLIPRILRVIQQPARLLLKHLIARDHPLPHLFLRKPTQVQREHLREGAELLWRHAWYHRLQGPWHARRLDGIRLVVVSRVPVGSGGNSRLSDSPAIHIWRSRDVMDESQMLDEVVFAAKRTTRAGLAFTPNGLEADEPERAECCESRDDALDSPLVVEAAR